MTKDRTSSVARADSDGASTMDLSGRCVGNSYVLQHPIGQGATGTVWRGVDRASGEPVAVKLLHESLLRQPRLVTRFVQERTILLMLRHRNVVRVRDLFSVGETLGLVMDLVDGGSLRDHLREYHTVPAGEAARLAAQVAAALAEAHELGVIHRDLKPDNVLLRVEGGRLDTRLTDFGIARILNTPSMTTPNAVVGTPHYMAPEAFHGVTASAATDVYALGVLLYELVSGRPPYDSDSIPDLMRRHMEGNPERRRGVPDGIWDLITQCMATKPRLRPTAAEMVGELSDAARKFVDVPALARPSTIGASAIDPDKSDLADLDVADRGVGGPGVNGQRADGGSLDLARRERGGSAGPIRGVPVQGRSAQGGSMAPAGGRRPTTERGHDNNRRGTGAEAAMSNGGKTPDAGGNDPEAVRLLPLPRHGEPANAAPRRRWARPGATTTTVIAGAMLAAAVAATGWHYRGNGKAIADPGAHPIVAVPTASERQFRETTRGDGPRRAAAAKSAAPPRLAPTDVARLVTSPRVPAKSQAPRVTTTRSPQPEAKPYGPWQCTQSIAFDFVSRLPVAPKPCQMLGRDIQYQASLTAPGGGTGSITVALQDAGNGRTVAGPRTCTGLLFGGDADTQGCGPAGANPAKGHKYVVAMSFRYVRGGQTVASTTKGAVFAW
ncbi:serine/threonine-protein kinase [Actinoplanes subtropicus]|uniref:serine/threonine-protein kinase n=1 Tax=Actinoplanes subtropicus TaxID=543632 RepID=UPI000AF6A5FA|nr:serine/threonine-protein kinase [Actinoplanes subtropicus]